MPSKQHKQLLNKLIKLKRGSQTKKGLVGRGLCSFYLYGKTLIQQSFTYDIKNESSGAQHKPSVEF